MPQLETPKLFNTIGKQVPGNFPHWVETVPARHIDRFFVLLRWVVLVFTGVPSLFGSLQFGITLIPTVTAVILLILYNIPVSLWLWYKKPLRINRVGWLLLGDTVIAVGATITTGGVGSFFFILFMQVIAEAALTLRWQPAAGVILILAALQLAVTSMGQPGEALSFVAYIAVSKFVLSLLVGGIAVLFGELLRQQEADREKANYAAERMAALNAIFVRLGETKLNLKDTLTVVLESAHVLPNIAFSMVMLPRWSEPGQWRIAASTHENFPVDTIIPDADWLQTAPGPLFSVGQECDIPMPPIFIHEAIACLIGIMLQSDEDVVGAMLIGQHTRRSLTDDEETFLKSLALEAGLAVRNARIFSREQAHVQQLEKFHAMQATFFSAIGHELKTPLAVLKMLAPSLPQLPNLPPETRVEITDTIANNLNRLENIIRDLLESSRLEAGAITFHPRPVDIAALVHTVAEGQRPLLAKKSQHCTTTIADGLPYAWVEPRRAEHVLSNLIQNATKFSPPDSEIEISVAQSDTMIHVCVSDAGDGVPVEHRALIFDKFYTTNTDKALAGVGLGLFICRELVTQSGGEIWVGDSATGDSRFCFTLPIAEEETFVNDAESE